MAHLSGQQFQQYLAGEEDPQSGEALRHHLSSCLECQQRLLLLAEEDERLTKAFVPGKDEEAWLEQIDLTDPVMVAIGAEPAHFSTFRFRFGEERTRKVDLLAAAALLLLLLVGTGWLAEGILRWIGPLLHQWGGGPVSIAIALGQWLVMTIIIMEGVMARAGLLGSLWPLIVALLLLWPESRRSVKEEQIYA